MIKWWRENRNHFFLLWIGSALIYAELMIHQLTNDYDGLWESSFHNAGTWELSLGRWFWQYVSRLRFGTSADPYTSLITLALMSFAMVLFADMLDVRNKWVIFLSGLLFLSHPSICFELSYRYMSPTFGVACLMSILAVWCFAKMKIGILAVNAGALCIAVSMGCYQAYICCTTVAFLTALLVKLSENTEWKKFIFFCVRGVAGILLGGAEYMLFLKLYLSVAGVEMSDYNGGDTYSVWNSVRQLPNSMRAAEQYFSLYFKGILYKINRMQTKHIFTVMFLVLSVASVIRVVSLFRQNKLKAVLLGLLFGLYPFAALAVLFIATDAVFALQMACGPALLLAAVTCLFGRGTLHDLRDGSAGEGRPVNRLKVVAKRGGRILLPLYMAVVLYGSICQVVIDQNTMYEGRKSTETIAEMIIDKLLQEDLISHDYTYLIYGTPSSCEWYSVDANHQYSNLYALYGAWYTGENSTASWNGVIRKVKGLNLQMVSGSEYLRLTSGGKMDDMPLFPAEGSIVLEGNIVYIKLSDAG